MPRCLLYHRLLLAFSFLWGITTLPAQQSTPRFGRLGAEHGLQMGNIDVVFQDSRGFIWIGGYAGLTRFDGYEAIRYVNDPADNRSIGDSRVTTILEARGGEGLWVGTQNNLNFFDRKTETFTRFFQEQGGGANSTRKHIVNICEKDSGTFWILEGRERIGVFEPEKGVARLLKTTGAHGQIHKMYKARDGVVWVGADNGLFKIDSKGEGLESAPFAGIDSIRPITSISEDTSGTLWLGSSNGVIRFDPRTGKAGYFPMGGDDYENVSAIEATRNGLLWCGTGKGLFRFDPKKEHWLRFQHDRGNANSLSSNSINYILEDNSGIIWIGTVAGVNVLRPSTEVFSRFPNNYQYEMTGVTQLRSFFEISPGKLLLWEKTGLMVFDWQKGEKYPFQYRPAQTAAWNTGVYCFFKDNRGRIWMGTHGGVFVFDPLTKAFTLYHKDSGDELALSSNIIRDIYQDGTGAVWVATWNNGANLIDENEGKVLHFFTSGEEKANYQNAARRIFEDRNGVIWVGTRGGLHKYERERKAFTRYHHDPGNPKSISENTAFDIFEDEKGFLWIGTYGGGLNKFDPSTESFRHFTTRNGLPDNNVFSIFPDHRGNLWLSTFAGIVKFDPEEVKFQTFDHRDGLLNKQFEAFSHYQSPYSGELFYEGKQGIDIFHPDSIRLDSTPPAIRFTDFQLFNRSVPIHFGGEGNSRDGFYLDQAISETTRLVLPYGMKVITFWFAALHYANPDKNQYAYWLENFDKERQYIGNSRSATFTNLSPGKYRLWVYASNADGVWNEEGASIEIIITPPWWLTWWAFLLYLSAAALVFYAYFQYQRRRWRLQSELDAQQRESRRLKELDAFKSRLYANFTHEFRTPLTIISGLTDEIPEYHQKRETGRLFRAVELVQRNSRRLLQLVNQILDLSRLEAGMMSLRMIQSDVVAFLKYLTESHESLADSKQIALTFESGPSSLVMDFDEEKLTHIFSNLLSNAIKFTDEGGAVSVRISAKEEAGEKNLLLEVRDTGIGIPESKLAHIFDRFYQIDSDGDRPGLRREGGTGIGLTLTKELVELLKGKIEVESVEGQGACFRVHLPVSNNSPLKKEGETSASTAAGVFAPFKAGSAQPLEPVATLAEDLPTLLIVEDSPDIITYLQACLEGRYEITTAPNGRLGVEKAVEEIPDIIISDVMMPEMDGFELCESLKTDPRTSHIPIILLTARATVEDRIAGLKRGADAYLDKPFSKEELIVRLEKLIELRAKLQERYASLVPPSAPEDPALKLEDEFVQNVLQLVEENLDDAGLSGRDLAGALHLSRAQVHRKLKALTGKSAGHFIRTVRLQKAMKMLQAGAGSVKNVAYDVGFNDPAYFSRIFTREFGRPPSEFLGGS
jgi:signal transduction histidine kinase/ligand-binding sensor domain-containing protein/DNA-binding response OmpR family regulator